tara:strand:- start:1236 stop:1427 length:192 start_codon:yes stop_codon:yes gene_type:complete
MLEMIMAGVVAHGIYHKTMGIMHDENEVNHVEMVMPVQTIKPTNDDQSQVSFVFEVCNPSCID